MKKIFYLFKVSFEKSIKEIYRYKFNTISDIVSYYILFISMFFGMKVFGTSMKVAPITLDDTLEGFVVGYFLWTVMVMVYSDTANNVISDSSKGTLEQISMSSLGLHNVLVVRSISNLLVNLSICFIVLFSIMATTGYWLNINIFELLIIIFIGVFSILGISLIFGGLALVFKKIQSFLSVIQFFLIALVIPGKHAFGSLITAILPFRPTIEDVYEITIGGKSITNFNAQNFMVLIGNSAFYFVIGLFIFKQCNKVAKKNGLLGQY